MSKFCPKHGDPKELPHMVDHCTCTFPIKLIGELVAVKFEDVGGNIRLPDWKRSMSGTVLSVGPECKSVKDGVRVSFGAAVGMDSVINGESIRIMKEQDLDFVYEDAPLCDQCGTLYVESGEDFCTECLDTIPSPSFHY